jgi:hypothetical protein
MSQRDPKCTTEPRRLEHHQYRFGGSFREIQPRHCANQEDVCASLEAHERCVVAYYVALSLCLGNPCRDMIQGYIEGGFVCDDTDEDAELQKKEARREFIRCCLVTVHPSRAKVLG